MQHTIQAVGAGKLQARQLSNVAYGAANSGRKELLIAVFARATALCGTAKDHLAGCMASKNRAPQKSKNTLGNFFTSFPGAIFKVHPRI